MKRAFSLVCVVLILGAIAMAQPDDWWKRKHQYPTPEPGATPMLILALGAVTSGVIAKRRWDANNPA